MAEAADMQLSSARGSRIRTSNLLITGQPTLDKPGIEFFAEVELCLEIFFKKKANFQTFSLTISHEPNSGKCSYNITRIY